MKTEVRNEGSGLAFILKVVGFIIILFLLPLVTLNSEAIDRYCESVEGQKVIFLVVVSGIGSYGILWFWNRLKKRLKEAKW